MHFSYLLAAAAATALASPISPRASSWTMQKFTRTCKQDLSTCHYSYSINLNNGAAAQGCAYDVTGSPATQTNYGVNCGAFVISSGWSGQFGPGNGFSTLAVKTAGQIIYPAYSDSELKNATAVSPDKSYTPAAITQAKNVELS